MTRPAFNLSLALGVALALLAAGARAAGSVDSDSGRQLVLRYLHDIDCGYAAMAALPENQSRFEARLPGRVPPAQHDAERAARAQALARRSAGCEHLRHQVRDVSIQFDPATSALLQQADGAGDRFARLRNSRLPIDGAPAEEQLRAQLYEVVHSGDALAISEIGRVLALSRDPARFGSTATAGDMSLVHAWLLVACDLGLECGTGSRELDHWCLVYAGGCARADLAAAIRLAHGEDYFNRIDAQRRILVERIRNQDWQAMFAPLAAVARSDSSGP